jgi:hypothetical protein
MSSGRMARARELLGIAIVVVAMVAIETGQRWV